MEIPISLYTWGMALMPIVLVVVLMLVFQLGAVKAAPITLLAGCATAVLVFRASLELLVVEILKGVWGAVSVIIVVFPAVLLYEVIKEARALSVFRIKIQKITSDRLLQVLAIGWVFVSFLQGITGFGVPIAVGAPLLLGIGLDPLMAVVIPMVGHAWGGTFGTLAVAWEQLVAQTGLSGGQLRETAFYACMFLWFWNFVSGMAVCWFYGKRQGIRKGWPAVVLISLIQGGGQVVLGQFNATLACFIPSCLAFAAIPLLGRMKRYRSDGQKGEEKYGETFMDTFSMLFPYLLLTGITVGILLTPPVKHFLEQWTISFSFPETRTGYGIINPGVRRYSSLMPFTHAGMFLLLTAVSSYGYYCFRGFIGKGKGGILMARSLKKTSVPAVSVICFIALSRVMSGSGQTQVLARGISFVMGEFYVVFAPIVGMTGSFMTSSTMSSNVLFGSFQMMTAKLLCVNIPAVLGAQTAGASIGNAIAPSSVVLGLTTIDAPVKEGMILKKVFPMCLGCAVILGISLLFL